MRGARRGRSVGVLVGVVAPACALAVIVACGSIACGARSELFLPLPLTNANDAAALEDAQIPEDALPGLDATARDVVPIPICADASDTLIYTVTESNTLLKFNPSNAQFTPIGTLDCPDPYGREPFSMAVDRLGNAYVLYFAPSTATAPIPGSIFKVNLNTAACEPTAFVPGQDGFDGFGMGFASDDVGGGETLYVASGDDGPGRLGAVDETTLILTPVGRFPSYVLGAELTGTGDGRLFAFYNPTFVNGSPNTGSTVIGQIDKTSGAVIAESPLPSVTQGAGWAFAFWGGNFYTFTSPVALDGTSSGTSIVQRFNPVDGTIVEVAAYPEVIDGAGVSTCAPVQ